MLLGLGLGLLGFWVDGPHGEEKGKRWELGFWEVGEREEKGGGGRIGFLKGFVENLALSSANASQNALWVMKLSFLEKRVPQSHLYSLVPQVLE